MTRALILLLAMAILAPGGYGAYAYVRDYDLYRGFAPPKEPAGIPRGTLQKLRFWSPALKQQRQALVYLPPGYGHGATRGVRYPVLYLLHAPVGYARNYIQTGGLAVRVDELLARRAIRPFITVIPKDHTFGGNHEWANTRAGRYEGFVLDTVHVVDSRYSTLRSRRARMLAGLSTGGFAAANIALQHLPVFGSFEAWSGYFAETQTDAFKGASQALLYRNSPALYMTSMTNRLRREPLRAFMYQGSDDDVSSGTMLSFARNLRAAGSHVTARVYPGKHNWRLWRSHFNEMLVFASRSLERAR